MYSIITNKDNLTKENARIEQVLQKNGHQESINSKIFKRITNNHSFSQLKLQTQATDIQEEGMRVSINYHTLKVKNFGVYSDLTK